MNTLKELAVIKQDIRNNQLASVANSEAFTRFLTLYTQANELMDQVKAELKARGIKELPTRLGTLGFEDEPRYGLIKGIKVRDDYLRSAVDKKAVDEYQAKYHKLPRGIKISLTKKFVKDLKVEV